MQDPAASGSDAVGFSGRGFHHHRAASAFGAAIPGLRDATSTPSSASSSKSESCLATPGKSVSRGRQAGDAGRPTRSHTDAPMR
eukprot:3820939-Prymnesium_polylepis.1